MKEEQTNLKVATLAGGCFWCIASDFENVSGVVKVISGYTGGQKENPTYEDVSTGKTGHYEAVQVYYDPSKVSYEQILDIFWRHIDPTDPGGQFADRGPQYRTAIFYHDDQQKAAADQLIMELNDQHIWDRPIVTEVAKFDGFFVAEDYHQEYFANNPYQPYCMMVVQPKVAKFRKHFLGKLKK